MMSVSFGERFRAFVGFERFTIRWTRREAKHGYRWCPFIDRHLFVSAGSLSCVIAMGHLMAPFATFKKLGDAEANRVPFASQG